jgi:hypothetical protein
LAAICCPHTALGGDQVIERVREAGSPDREQDALLEAYHVGDRTNRRHKARPGVPGTHGYRF